MHFVSIHVYIIESKFGGKILMFTEVMSCTIFVASSGAIFPMEKLRTKKPCTDIISHKKTIE